jgi:hypothetical protein
MIYLCNPNNPTSTVTPKAEIGWMVANLPANTILLIDEAYMHFADTPEMESGLTYVRQGKDVVVTRTYSKIYGMAGLRAGFAAARPDLIHTASVPQPTRDGQSTLTRALGLKIGRIVIDAVVPDYHARLPKPSVGGWGLREGATAWVFSAAGLGADRGAATAVAYGVMVLAASLPGGLVLVVGWLPRRRASRPGARRRVIVRPKGAADA